MSDRYGYLTIRFEALSDTRWRGRREATKDVPVRCWRVGSLIGASGRGSAEEHEHEHDAAEDRHLGWTHGRPSRERRQRRGMNIGTRLRYRSYGSPNSATIWRSSRRARKV